MEEDVRNWFRIIVEATLVHYRSVWNGEDSKIASTYSSLRNLEEAFVDKLTKQTKEFKDK